MVNRSPSRSGSRSSSRRGVDGSAGSGGAGSNSGSSGPIFELLVIFGLVFAIQQFTAIVGAMAGLFVLAPPLAENPWTIATSVYAHIDIWHLLSNSLALIVFGWPVARATTRARFHAFVLVTGSLAGVSQVLLTGFAAAAPLVDADPTGVLGASGAVFALLGYLVTSNRLSSGFASVVHVPQWLTLLVFVGLALAVTLATAAPRVALIAHFTGFLLGLLAGRARVLQVNSGSSAGRSVV